MKRMRKSGNLSDDDVIFQKNMKVMGGNYDNAVEMEDASSIQLMKDKDD
jgi:hypothetical protein